MTDILSMLSAPFAPELISWRIGSTTQDKSKGMALAYIDARDVMKRFDAVCTPFGWQNDHLVSPNGMVTCKIGVLSPNGCWIWKADGAGQTDVEGEKGSYSDALKRSAVLWGVGRYLYDLDSPWVQIEPAGRSYKIAQHEIGKLRDLLYRVNKTIMPGAPIGSKGATPFDRRPDTSSADASDSSPAEEFFQRAKLAISNQTDPVALKAWVDANMTYLDALPKDQGKMLWDQYKKRMGALAHAPGKAA